MREHFNSCLTRVISLELQGWYATNAVMGTGRVNNSGVMLFGMGSTEERILKALSNYRTEVSVRVQGVYKFCVNTTAAFYTYSILDLCVYLMKPFFLISIRLKSLKITEAIIGWRV